MTALTNRYEDDDASHLPPGMKRVGYDADTERYTFRDGGDLWLGEPGSLYGGQMKWAGRVLGGAEAQREDGIDDAAMYSSGTDSIEHCEPITPPSEERFHEHRRKALVRYPSSRRNIEEGKCDQWGVPTISISATGAEPPDGTPDNGGLKRRASKIIEVAGLTADTIGLNRWTNQRATTKAARQEKLLPSQGRRRGSEHGS